MKNILLFCALFTLLFSYPAMAEVTPGDPPTIIQHPEDTMVRLFEVGEFSVTATGTAPLTYQWQMLNINGDTWSDIREENTSKFIFNTFALHVGTLFRVVVSNSYGSSTSDIAKLTLTPLIALPPPAESGIVIESSADVPPFPPKLIIIQPATSTDVTEGNITGSLFVEAFMESIDVLSRDYKINYQWFSNTTNSNKGGTLASGANSASFTIPTTLTVNGSPYYYYCEFTVELGAELFEPIASEVAAVIVNKANSGGGCNSIMATGQFEMLIVFLSLAVLCGSEIFSIVNPSAANVSEVSKKKTTKDLP